MEERKKAQEVFNETNFVFAKKGSFADAFPEIETIKVDVKESGEGTRWSGSHSYNESSVAEYVNCSNPRCYGGGFSIGEQIRKARNNKETHAEGKAFCKGYEGSPKGKKRYRTCMNDFAYTIDIKYKEPPAEVKEDSTPQPENK